MGSVFHIIMLLNKFTKANQFCHIFANIYPKSILCIHLWANQNSLNPCTMVRHFYEIGLFIQF